MAFETGRWRVQDRPRERLLRQGASVLNTAEILALCLGSGNAQGDALEIAHGLLAQFGSVEAVLASDATKLMACVGIGPAKAALLKAVHELTIRHAEERFAAGCGFTDVREVSTYLQRQIGRSERELFGCMFLDTRHRLLSWDVLFSGSINRTHVHAREVLKRALQLNAAALVLAHNHPSGIAEPSQADLLLTRDLTDLMARVDIRIIDHIIVTGGHTVSFAARGLLT